MKQGEYAQRRKKSFGVVGTISVLGATWSTLNHWHPHVHELNFTVQREDATMMLCYERESHTPWRQAAEREGLHMNEHGYD